MKITLTKVEATSILKQSLTSPVADVTVEIVDAPFAVNAEGRPVAKDFPRLTQVVRESRHDGKIESIKRVRQWFHDNGLQVGLADSKFFVEAILDRR